MNLYLVVSEELTEVVWEDWFNQVGHFETYSIVALVIARNRSSARWLAWKSDSKGIGPGPPTEMPKMSCRKRATLPDSVSPGIVTRDPAYQFAWADEECHSVETAATP